MCQAVPNTPGNGNEPRQALVYMCFMKRNLDTFRLNDVDVLWLIMMNPSVNVRKDQRGK